MAGWIGRLVEIDDARADIGLKVALQWVGAVWDGSKVAGTGKYWENCQSQGSTRTWNVGTRTFVPVLEQKRPGAGVHRRSDIGGLDSKLVLLLVLLNDFGRSHAEC